MNQVLFLFSLYVYGVVFGLLFKRHLPAVLIAITGFLWGTLFWVVGGMIALATSLPYTPGSMISYFIVLMIGFGIIHARNNTWALSRREITWILSIASTFLLVLFLASRYNFSAVSSDSIIQIVTGRRIAYEGFSTAIIEELSKRDAFLSLLQSASVFLGDDYICTAQPVFAFTFVLLFNYLGYQIVSQIISNKRLTLTLTALSGIVLFSTYFIIYQSFYIHNNLISAMYLFAAVSMFWLARIESNDHWMIFGMLSLLGFSLARTEAPIFALIFLALVISAGHIPYRLRLVSMIPYLLFLGLWYSYLLARMGEGTKILDPEKTLAIIGALIAIGLLVLVSELNWIKRFLLPQLPKLMVVILLIMLAFLIYQKPEHIKDSILATLINMMSSGRWGITWLMFSLYLALSLAGPKVPWEEIFFYGIVSFFCLILAIVFFRKPYHTAWGDSGNRMLTHILPISILYVLMKTVQSLPKSTNIESKRDSSRNL